MIRSGAIPAPPVVRSKRWNVSSRRSITPRNAPGMPTGHVSGASGSSSVSVRWSSISSGSKPGRSYLLTNASSGIPRARATWNSCSVCGSTPRAASTRITAQSTAASTRSVSSEKSLCPGVSSRLKTTPSCSKRSTVEVTEIPRRRSSSIQSEVAALRPLRAVTDPASPTAPA